MDFMAKRNSVDHTTMRAMNTALILRTLYRYAPISRAGLASRTGLNKTTVSNLVRDLLTNRLAREMAVDAVREIGRPAINLELNPDAGYLISADMGVDFIRLVVVNFALEMVLHRYESTVNLHAQDAILDRLVSLLHEAQDQFAHRKRPVFGLSVGVPGLVDNATGKLLFAPNLTWKDVPLRSLLSQEFDMPIYISNEANLAALAESYLAVEQDGDFLLYISSGVGLGGGIVLNGQLMTGPSGFAGEIGHMTVQRDGRPCHCGNRGCWETVASQQALFRAIRRAIRAGQSTSLADMACEEPECLTVPLIVKAADEGDTVALEALAEIGEWLGIGIANVVNVINPRQVVFGGPLAEAHAYLLPIIRQIVAERAFIWSRSDATLRIARYLADTAVMGGVAMIHQDVLSNPLNWMS